MAADGVSVASMLQKSDDGQGLVPLVFMTHQTTAGAMDHALHRMADAGLLKEPAVCYRVL
jgi:homoserine dehydrogenase